MQNDQKLTLGELFQTYGPATFETVTEEMDIRVFKTADGFVTHVLGEELPLAATMMIGALLAHIEALQKELAELRMNADGTVVPPLSFH